MCSDDHCQTYHPGGCCLHTELGLLAPGVPALHIDLSQGQCYHLHLHRHLHMASHLRVPS